MKRTSAVALVKQAILALVALALAVIVVGGLLLIKNAFFPPATVEQTSRVQSNEPSPLTAEEEARLIKATTASDENKLSPQEEQALINLTSASSVPHPVK